MYSTWEERPMNVRNIRSRTVTALVLLILCLLLSLLAGWAQASVFTFERPPRVHEIGLADLTGNGYLDAYLAIGHGSSEPYIHPDYVLFNEGDGRFVDSGQNLANWNSRSVKLEDVTGDGHIDAVVGIDGGVLIHFNDGRGFLDGDSYTATGVSPGTFRLSVALADLNGNGSPDIFGAACCGGGTGQPPLRPYFSEDRVWRNNGSGRFILHGTSLAATGSNGVALGDLNGSGFTDAFIAAGQSTNADRSTSSNSPNTVWFNDGDGRFSDSGQRLGQRESMAVALGNLNGNGFLDAVVGNQGADEVWLNDGTGLFSNSGQRLGRGLTQAVFLADLNGNGHLDLVTAGVRSARVWLNDGTGRFSAGQQIAYNRYEMIAVGDVTGDGQLDIFVAGVESYRVWRGVGNGRLTAERRTDFR
jgi:hypothetical protein